MNTLSYISGLIALIFLISAHTKSDFSDTRKKPNSLVYYQNADTGSSYWVTYDKMLDSWTKGYLGDTPEEASKYVENVSGSKYNRGFTFASEAPQKNIQPFKVEISTDILIHGFRNVSFTIIPKRQVNQIGLYADKSITFRSLSFNGKSIPKDSSGNVYANRRSNKLLRFYVAENDSLEVSYSIKEDVEVSFTVVEYSFDLLSNPQFTINKRPKDKMPKPFVVTDAIAVQKSISPSSMQVKVQDTINEIPSLNE